MKLVTLVWLGVLVAGFGFYLWVKRATREGPDQVSTAWLDDQIRGRR
jgi:drug/metabolite transporter (DMT)-like permease